MIAGGGRHRPAQAGLGLGGCGTATRLGARHAGQPPDRGLQTVVSLALARGQVPMRVGLRLFVPGRRTADPGCMRRAGLPAEVQAARTTPEIAIEEIGRLRASGDRQGSPSNLPADISLRAPAAAIKPHRVRGQAHQQSRQELGLVPFEGGSRAGPHRHAPMATPRWRSSPAPSRSRRDRPQRRPPPPTTGTASRAPPARPSARHAAASARHTPGRSPPRSRPPMVRRTSGPPTEG